ncbi:MAG: CPBP family glutamic-type intramembrane protease [Bacteroidetes bacterium]|nr:CPBP family glutamic-type intramembrane protease [Bacteroidota bacterium]
MQIKYNVKTLVVIIFSLFFLEFLFGQKILDHEQFIEKIKHSSDNIYKECIKEYDAYLDKFPDDVSVLIEKCKFIQNAQYDEDEYFNPNQAEFDSCSADIINRFPAHPEVLLFQTTFLWGDEKKEVFTNAEKSIKDNPEKWNNTNLAAMYETMANYYYSESDYKQAIFYMDKAISNDEQYKYSLEYVRILLGLEKKDEALSVLIAIPDTTKDIWQLVQKANLLLELKDYSNALNIYNQVEQMDSTYINNADFASTLEGIGQYELARKYLVADTSKTYDKKEALIKLLNHDIKYQDGSKSIASYNALRDLGYSSDPIVFYRLKVFFSHPTQPWGLRDLLGIISLLALLAILIIIPYVWILPVYFVGKRFKFLSPKNAYESNWTLKAFWFVSIGYLFASLFACIIEPGELYSIFNNSYYAGMSSENRGFEVLVFTIIMALFGLMAMYKVNPKVLLSSSWSIGKSILTGVGIFFLFKLISGIYISFGTKVFDVSIDDIANIPKILLATKQEIGAVISTFGKGSSILLLGFLIPIYEEIIFRGVILDACQRHINFNAANIFQALLFAAVHGSLFMLPVFFLFGILAGVARKKSGGLLPCIVFHILNNTIAILIICIK